MEDRKLLKILCIHGYRQSAQIFREKTGSFRKMLKKHAEFVYITAPHKVPPGNLGSAAWENVKSEGSDSGTGAVIDQREADERGWWFSREDDYFKSTDYSDISKGFDASVEMLTKMLESEEEGGFDGIMSFSQGASLVSMLCLMQEAQNKKWFKFAILVAGFKSPSSNHDIHYSSVKSMIPSLHVIGETDQIIAPERSEELAKYFDSARYLKHGGGHFVPASGPQKKVYLEFLDDMFKHCGISQN